MRWLNVFHFKKKPMTREQALKRAHKITSAMASDQRLNAEYRSHRNDDPATPSRGTGVAWMQFWR